MIDPECFSSQWIYLKAKDIGYPDKNLLEKVIRHFYYWVKTSQLLEQYK